ncbi:GspH/FimT family pseudopilin [Marinomonas epiphytica]
MAKQNGFTLLECMVVIAMLSALAYGTSHVVFGFRQSEQDKQSLLEDLQALSVALMAARQYAIRSGQTTYLCGGVLCTGDWSSGYRIQHTVAADTLADDSQSEGSSLQVGYFSPTLRLRWQGFPSQRRYIEFLANGLSAYQNGRFILCVGEWQGEIVLNQSGRFYLSDIIKAKVGCA